MTEKGSDVPNGNFSIRHIGRHSFIYGAGVLLSRAIAFVMLPVYTRVMTPTDFGALQLIETTLKVISIIAGSRLAAGVFHYYHKAATTEDKRAVLSTALVVLVSSYAMASGATFLLAPRIAALVFGVGDGASVDYIRIAAGSLFLYSFLVVPLSFLQLRERSTLFVGRGTRSHVGELGPRPGQLGASIPDRLVRRTDKEDNLRTALTPFRRRGVPDQERRR